LVGFSQVTDRLFSLVPNYGSAAGRGWEYVFRIFTKGCAGRANLPRAGR
jgi:hypothetical protein